MNLYDEKVTLILTKSQLATILDSLEYVASVCHGDVTPINKVHEELSNQAKNQK